MAIKRIFFISLIMLLSLPAAHAAGTDNGKDLPSWKGRWITTDRAQGTPNTWLIYRKEVNLDKVPETTVWLFLKEDSNAAQHRDRRITTWLT